METSSVLPALSVPTFADLMMITSPDSASPMIATCPVSPATTAIALVKAPLFDG